ncbi:MAG: hypothetical protein ABW175_14925 [Bradyrhizobium sp.]
MRDLNGLIEQATRHVEEGRRIVARQRKSIAAGNDNPAAIKLLRQFEKSQAIFQEHLERLQKEQDAILSRNWRDRR